MRRRSLTGALLVTLFAAGCGWSPPSGNPTSSPTACASGDSPTAETVAAELAEIPAPAGGGEWHESARGHAGDCRLNWVQVASNNAAPDSPGQLLFFDRAAPVGTPTPEPRPYIAVVGSGSDSVTVQYQWKQGDDAPCCPTGIGTARFRIEGDQLKALDPVPGP